MGNEKKVMTQAGKGMIGTVPPSASTRPPPLPPVYRPNGTSLQAKLVNAKPSAAVSAPPVVPPVFRPSSPGKIAQAKTARPAHPAPVPPFAANSHSRPAALTSFHVLQRSKGASGGKGGAGYGDAGNNVSDERFNQALENVGLKGIKGHVKGGSGSAESSQTKNERALVVAELQRLDKVDYDASRPKAVIKPKAKMDDIEKAKQKIEVIKKNFLPNDWQEQFDKYLEARGLDFEDSDLDKLYALM